MHVYTITIELLPEESADVCACSTKEVKRLEAFREHSVSIA
jgi:hypothetical protein